MQLILNGTETKHSSWAMRCKHSNFKEVKDK